MSELAEIAAAAGITILDSSADDDVGSNFVHSPDNCSAVNLHQVQIPQKINDADCVLSASGDSVRITEQLEALFAHRYSEKDPDFVANVKFAADSSRPPCLPNFFVRRSRDDSYRDRGRGGRNEWRGSGDQERYRHGNRDGYSHRNDYSNDRWNSYNDNRRWRDSDNRSLDSRGDRDQRNYGYSQYNRRDRSPHF